ncbi:hypothetical protein Vretimale_4958 [Volvox reticuliferus]|uniref:Uncharacterized protein n=1 Tax=Volvox reticuliferus TaxID=1737510 RepID=A0A8J4C3U0_9CHLO|nr:hypothetical protein Vretifemale_4151 [Volvox reticuliferus]GIL99917.1 hypothetical protein Vretimale_4958 [Volvox reticuliferus]
MSQSVPAGNPRRAVMRSVAAAPAALVPTIAASFITTTATHGSRTTHWHGHLRNYPTGRDPYAVMAMPIRCAPGGVSGPSEKDRTAVVELELYTHEPSVTWAADSGSSANAAVARVIEQQDAAVIDAVTAAAAAAAAAAASHPSFTLSSAGPTAKLRNPTVTADSDLQAALALKAQRRGQHQPQRPAVLLAGRRQLLLQGAGALMGGVASANGAPLAPAAAAANPPSSGTCPVSLVASGGPAGGNLANAAAPRGWRALRDPAINRGLATTAAVRQQYGLEGLLPAPVTAPQVEVLRAAAAVQRAAAAAVDPATGGGSSLLAYCALMGLRETDQATFFSLVQQDVERYLPLIYTPTVGDACLAWGSLLPRPTGLTISLKDAGRVQQLVENWATGQPQARIAVITDGERILGLGDLGAYGLGIPVGKAAVYGAAGVNPDWVLPIALDVGCNTASVVNDPLYVGLRRPRERGSMYYELVDEVIAVLQTRYGSELLIHWEDVGAAQAFPLLERLESRGVPTFNDDIQATAAVTLAALLGAERLEGVPPLERQTFLFFGAGQANLGVASLLCAELESRGLDPTAAVERVWLVDRRGLVTTDRSDLSAAKAIFAKRRPAGLSGDGADVGRGGDGSGGAALADLVAAIRPTALIGAATVGGAFNSRVLSLLRQVQSSPSSRPLVFALSNPTSRAECSFQQAWEGTGGRAVFASGTQFPPLQVANRTLVPAQANNCLVFPGLGAGCVASGATRVTEAMLLAAARAVAELTTSEDLAAERVLPNVGRLGECTVAVAAAVARAAAVDMVTGGGSPDATCLGPLLLELSPPAAPLASDRGLLIARPLVSKMGPGIVQLGGSDGGSDVAGGDDLTKCLTGLLYRPL